MDTFERLFATLKTAFLEKAVKELGRMILDVLEKEKIAIYGKKLCGTALREKSPKGDYLLNAFVAENSLFVGQEKIRNKENAIHAVSRHLDRLEITGSRSASTP